MSKITKVSKSRKEHKCNKCNKLIPIGSSYLRANMKFGPSIIRCNDCGLEPWEATTSEWTRNTGYIINRWREFADATQTGIDEICSMIDDICYDENEKYSNLPEQLQYADIGTLLEERISACENAQSELESIDIDGLKDYVLNEFLNEYELEQDMDYEAALVYLNHNDYARYNEIQNELKTAIENEIDSALSYLEV